MKPAHEHPDTAEVVFDVALARLAVGFVALTIGAPLLLALFR